MIARGKRMLATVSAIEGERIDLGSSLAMIAHTGL
jgi:hypothetical protein